MNEKAKAFLNRWEEFTKNYPKLEELFMNSDKKENKVVGSLFEIADAIRSDLKQHSIDINYKGRVFLDLYNTSEQTYCVELTAEFKY